MIFLICFNYFFLLIGKGKRHCSDFNSIASVGALAGLDNIFVCPNDGISRVFCSDEIKTKNINAIRSSSLKWSEILIFMNVANDKFRLDILIFWLDLLPNTDPDNKLDLFLISDDNSTEQHNRYVPIINSKYSNIMVHMINGRVDIDSGYHRLPCKQIYGMNQIYNKFPKKKYYFKVDDDTILFPSRLLKFLNTLDSVINSEVEPIYFGTVLNNHKFRILCDELGYNTITNSTVFPSHGKLEEHNNITSTCYTQGGAGYGLNNIAFKSLAMNSSFCTSSEQYETDSEDTYVGYRMFKDFRTVPIHCGSFRPNNNYAENTITRTISLHHIDKEWIQSHLIVKQNELNNNNNNK